MSNYVNSLIIETPVQQITSSGAISLVSNTVYRGSISAATQFTLLSVAGTTANTIKLFLTISGAPTINWGTTHFINGETPDVSENGDYIVYYDYFTPGNYWCCGSMKVS